MSEADILPAPEITTSTSAEMSQWELEKRAFRRLLPSLLSTHRGLYVAIHGEQIVGKGADQFSVAREAYRTYGYVPIYVGLVTGEPPRPVRVPTPRYIARGTGKGPQ